MKSINSKTDGLKAAKTPSFSTNRWPLVSLSLSMLLSSLGASITHVGLPTLALEFNATFQQTQWIVLAYLLAITTLIVSVGRLGDLIGRRRLLLAGIALFTLASALCGIASSLGLLIATRIVQGLGAAIMMALTMAFASEIVPKAKMGSAMGLLGTMSAVGTALGPSLGGVLITEFGWPAIFFVNVPLGVFALFVTHRFLPADHLETSTDRIKFDHTGTLLLALTLAAYALAMTTGRGSFGTVNIMLLLMASIGVILFVVAEARAASPLISLAIFRNPLLSAGFLMSMLVTTVVMATLVVGPFYLSGTLALNASHTGAIMACGPIAASLVGFPAGRLVDSFGTHCMTLIGLIVMAAGTLMLATLPTTFGIPAYITSLVILTAGYALFQAANNTAVMMNIQPDQRGAVSGVLNLSRNLGLITGTAVMGAVFALGSATNTIITARPEAIAGGMQATFFIATLLIIVALAVALLSRVFSQRLITSSQ